MTDEQMDYGIKADDPCYCITPTHKQIQTGKLKHCWRINHSSYQPTHRLEFDKTENIKYPYGRPVLIPLRTLEAGVEITFDYNNELKL